MTQNQTPTLIFSALFLAALACGQATPPTSTVEIPSPEAGAVVKGYGISPQGFPADYTGFPAFLAEVGALPNSGIMFNGAWREDVAGGSDAGNIPPTAITIVEQASVFGYTPVIVFGWRSDDGSLHVSIPANSIDDWRNEDAKALFEQMLIEFAGTYHPPYLFLGNESDAYFISNPDDYARWIEFYNRAYDAVKSISSETMVGPIFQYERMSGQGNFNQWTTAQWGALELHDFSKIDIVGITVYPWISVATPEEIPDNYFEPLIEHVGDKPVAITETGWPGADLGLETTWETSPEVQVRYIEALNRILGDVNLKILNWLHYYQMSQPEGNQLFWQAYSSISLRGTEGNKRLFYDNWVAFQP